MAGGKRKAKSKKRKDAWLVLQVASGQSWEQSQLPHLNFACTCWKCQRYKSKSSLRRGLVAADHGGWWGTKDGLWHVGQLKMKSTLADKNRLRCKLVNTFLMRHNKWQTLGQAKLAGRAMGQGQGKLWANFWLTHSHTHWHTFGHSCCLPLLLKCCCRCLHKSKRKTKRQPQAATGSTAAAKLTGNQRQPQRQRQVQAVEAAAATTVKYVVTNKVQQLAKRDRLSSVTVGLQSTAASRQLIHIYGIFAFSRHHFVM